MRSREILFTAGVAILLAACAKEKTDIQMTPGEEVQFAAKLNSTSTKTIYGDETESGFKVNWVNKDKVLVYGTNCSSGRDLAEYQVSVESAIQNFATSLDKTGDCGIQWGDEASSDFYSVYPSSNDGHDFTITPNSDGDGVKVGAYIRTEQNCVFHKVTNESSTGYAGDAYSADAANPSMPDAVMYACTTNVRNGATVNLRYKPYSTVLKFRFKGYTSDIDLSDPTVYVSRLTLTAPAGVKIAGSFDLDVKNDGTAVATPSSTASNQIVVNTLMNGGAYVPIKKGEYLEVCVFVIPQANLSLNDEGWSVKMESTGGNFTYNIKPTANTNPNWNLTAGMIHKLNIPAIKVTEKVNFDPKDWISEIPRNVYISELSLPGAWYATNEEYQATIDLNEQFKYGVRAFNIDCRLTFESSNRTNTEGRGNLRLVCAGSDHVTPSEYDNGDLVLDKLKSLGELAKNNPDEYIVVVLTIAEKPMTRKRLFTTYKFGNVDPSQVLPAIATMLSDSSLDDFLYRTPISSSTTVKDVLGKVIVKVNANTGYDKFSKYSSVPGTLISEASMASDSDYISGDIIAGRFSSMQTSDIYWGKNTQTDLKFYYHQAQITYADYLLSSPTYSDRKAAIDDIIKQSQNIYNNNNHNGWFQLGIGGRTNNNDNTLEVANVLNPYVLNIVNDKLNSENDLTPSPVGIVLMNYCTGTADQGNGLELCKAILAMNSKFRLNRDTSKPEWPGSGGESGTTSQNDSSFADGGEMF